MRGSEGEEEEEEGERDEGREMVVRGREERPIFFHSGSSVSSLYTLSLLLIYKLPTLLIS